MAEKQKEINTKENNDKILIEKYKKLLQDANNQISELNDLINNIKMENEKNSNNNDKKDIVGNKLEKNRNIKYITNDYSLTFPEKYHGMTYNLEKMEKTKDGITINYYNNNKKEMIYKNGMRKEIYGEDYQIIYFNNGDIKQIFPKENKQIYYFQEKEVVQTTLGDDCQIFRYKNGQIEKNFNDGTKQIIFPDGKIKNILPNGYEETYNLNE